jgi:hypothetical protein
MFKKLKDSMSQPATKLDWIVLVVLWAIAQTAIVIYGPSLGALLWAHFH